MPTAMKVLVVDDDADARDILKMCLEIHNFRCGVASTVEEALPVLSRYDALVTDLGLSCGRRSGLKLAGAFKAVKPTKRVIVVSGGRPEALPLAHVDAWLEKPFEVKDLVKALTL